AWEPAALDEVRRTKKKVRAFELACDRAALGPRLVEYRSVLGGLLAQSADLADLDEAGLAVVSRRPPTDAERQALRFAWRVVKHAKSNAIVLATRDQLIGVGAGQTNRLDSARIAVMRARELGLETAGTVCASDAFFPFRDGLDVVARAGATAVIQPGGSPVPGPRARRAASGPLDSGATVRQIRQALDALRRQGPGLGSPLAETRLVVEGSRVLAQTDRVRFDPRTGQTVLALDVGGL